MRYVSSSAHVLNRNYINNGHVLDTDQSYAVKHKIPETFDHEEGRRLLLL